MIDPAVFLDALRGRGVRLFAGVPDSLLKDLCACVDDRAAPGEHLICANEGNAIGVAAGHHLATGGIAVVYMQNSGLGNAINPLASLTSAEVYRMPVLLIVGWRGEPGVHDEPQHVMQGRITPGQLDLLDIPYRMLQADSPVDATLDAVFADLRGRGSPAALLVRKDAFASYKARSRQPAIGTLTREEALAALLPLLGADDLLVSTTGKTSRELFELRVRRGEKQRDFLTVGSMGHTASIACGIALARPDRRVVCIDGDGSLIMHLGALPVIGKAAPRNLLHVVMNNAAHESVGGQATAADRMDLPTIARACGYAAAERVDSAAGLAAAVARLAPTGPALIEMRIRQGSRADLGRPTSTAEENKLAFMEHAGAR